MAQIHLHRHTTINNGFELVDSNRHGVLDLRGVASTGLKGRSPACSVGALKD